MRHGVGKVEASQLSGTAQLFAARDLDRSLVNLGVLWNVSSKNNNHGRGAVTGRLRRERVGRPGSKPDEAPHAGEKDEVWIGQARSRWDSAPEWSRRERGGREDRLCRIRSFHRIYTVVVEFNDFQIFQKQRLTGSWAKS